MILGLLQEHVGTAESAAAAAAGSSRGAVCWRRTRVAAAGLRASRDADSIVCILMNVVQKYILILTDYIKDEKYFG